MVRPGGGVHEVCWRLAAWKGRGSGRGKQVGRYEVWFFYYRLAAWGGGGGGGQTKLQDGSPNKASTDNSSYNPTLLYHIPP